MVDFIGEYGIQDVALFLIIVVTVFAIDMFNHREDKPVSFTSAAIWSVIWITVSLTFAGYIYTSYGQEKFTLFMSGYLMEKSLSVDNLIAFSAVFSAFSISAIYQHRVLFWGIIGAKIFRLIFIASGVALLSLGNFMMVIVGGFVLWTAWLMYKQMNEEEEEIEDYSHHWSVNLTKKIIGRWPLNKFLGVHNRLDGHKFIRKGDCVTGSSNVWCITPLFLCLICMETVDILFSFDSVPVIISITKDPFLIYTSNIFAILGLRSLFFCLEALKRYMCHLEIAIIFLLIYVGVKAILSGLDLYHVNHIANLIVIGTGLSVGIFGSLIFPDTDTASQKA